MSYTMDHKEGAYKVRDLSLADAGRMRIEWAESRMPVLMRLREEYSQSQPFKGYKITGCLHVTKETAVLIETLAACGAEVAWSGCNPLSTNDEVAAALAKAGIEIYAWYGQNVEEFYWSIDRTIDNPPHTTLDDGADLVKLYLDGPALVAEYSLGNLSPFPFRFVWAAHALMSLPANLGHEIAGVVVEAGAACDVALGSRVAVDPTLGCAVRGIEPPCAKCAAARASTRSCDAKVLRRINSICHNREML